MPKKKLHGDLGPINFWGDAKECNMRRNEEADAPPLWSELQMTEGHEYDQSGDRRLRA